MSRLHRIGRRRAKRGRRSPDEGVALVLTLCLVLVASAIGAGLMLLSQTETYSGLNYRAMTQARYAAESGVHAAVNYLLNGYPQPNPTTDPLSAYTMTGSPVTANGAPVVLSSNPNVASNYPVGSTETAFSAATQGTLALGGLTATYTASAQLLSMQTITAYGTGTQSVIQTWQITADGTTNGSRSAVIEVTAVLEQQAVPTHSYALFATAATCGAIDFGGSASTDSYSPSSVTYVNGAPQATINNSAGNIGTNGNLTATGNIRIYGTLSTPRTGVGSCSSGGVDAYTDSSGSPCIDPPTGGCTQGVGYGPGGLVNLPQTVAYPTPTLAATPPTTAITLDHNSTCATLSLTLGAGQTCTLGTSTQSLTSGQPQITLDPAGGVIDIGNLAMTHDMTFMLEPGTYVMNSLSTSGSTAIQVDTTRVTDASPVTIQIAGAGNLSPNTAGNPIDFSNGAAIDVGNLDPATLIVQYGGTGTVTLTGGSESAALIYAPNAAVQVTRGGAFYGSIVGNTVTDTGGTVVNYDTNLQYNFMTLGNYMLSTFSWKKF